MIIAPKGRGWTAIVEKVPADYSFVENQAMTENRDRFWRSLRKRVANGSRIGRL